MDPVLNIYPETEAVTTDSADEICADVRAEGLDVVWIRDTHPHADHFGAAPDLSQKLGAPTGIGEDMTDVQKLWKDLSHPGDAVATGRSHWDRLFADGDEFMVGEIPVKAMFSPDHTLTSIAGVAGDAAFVLDTFMMPAGRAGRPDFPGGATEDLWQSLRAILELSGNARLYVGHDYPGDGVAPEYMATVAQHPLCDRHAKDGPGKAEFIATRNARDATLPLAAWMLAAIQADIRGGHLTAAEADGHSHLKIPVGKFGPR